MQLQQHPGRKSSGDAAVNQQFANPVEQGGIGIVLGQLISQLQKLRSLPATPQSINQSVFRYRRPTRRSNGHGMGISRSTLRLRVTQEAQSEQAHSQPLSYQAISGSSRTMTRLGRPRSENRMKHA